MKTYRPRDYTGLKAWDALDIESIGNATIRMHWTDRPYKGHINDGPEVFVVLDGAVDMHTRIDGEERLVRLETGDVFHAQDGDEHFAHPDSVARVLVIEKRDSV